MGTKAPLQSRRVAVTTAPASLRMAASPGAASEEATTAQTLKVSALIGMWYLLNIVRFPTPYALCSRIASLRSGGLSVRLCFPSPAWLWPMADLELLTGWLADGNDTDDCGKWWVMIDVEYSCTLRLPVHRGTTSPTSEC